MILHVAVWLLALIYVSQGEPKVLSEIDELRYKFIEYELELWESVVDEQTNSLSGNTTPELDLIRAYKTYGDQLEEFKDFEGLKPLENVWVWARTYGELRGVYALYETFRRFQKLQTDSGRVPSPKQAWIDLADTILNDPKSSVLVALDKIHDLIKTEKLFQEALKEIVFEQCEVHQSPQQILFNLYNTVALIELKGYIMIQFAYQLTKLFNEKADTSVENAQTARLNYKERAIETVDNSKAAMHQTTRQLWICDPKIHVKDETYTEITKLLQAYIENEIDMSQSQSCFKNCAYYDYAKSNGCYKNQFCSKQPRCKGKVLNCQYIDSDMWVCPSNKADRRYEYIEYENGRILGRKMGCNSGTTKVDSWWRYVFWHCSYCICLCDDEDKSDRYFNLREYVSDVNNNKVVTGLKFVKKNQLIHLQIQEGELLPYGKINETTVKWKPIDNYKVTDRKMREGKDFHMLQFSKRDIDLDDLTLDHDHLVTGVKFRLVGTHINLEIRSTPYDYKTGKLIHPEYKSFWHSNDFAPLNRNKLRLITPDVPTRSFFPSRMDSVPNQYVEFTHTDFDRDVGQTTIPFIDTQAVVSAITVPLSGAGIYHKGQTNFGGFIAPKIMTIDYAQYLGVKFPKTSAREDDLLGVRIN